MSLVLILCVHDKTRVVTVCFSCFVRSNVPPKPDCSYNPDDEFQHFYRWTSPPGIIKIMSVIVIVMCVAIFACVASTLAWDSQGAMSGFRGLWYGAVNGYGGNYNDPRAGKGFIIAMAAITFITSLVIFIIIVSHQSLSESRKFYLAVVILCAILGLLMLVAAIVYLVAVNPMAQSSGSVYGSQIAGICAQYQQPQPSGVFVNQYLYHYCVVEPQEVNTHVFTSLFCFFVCVFFSFKSVVLFVSKWFISDFRPSPWCSASWSASR